MKKILLIFSLLISVSSLSFGQYNKQLEKESQKMYKQKIKEYKKDGWKLDSSSKTLEVALLEHYDKLNKKNDEGEKVFEELPGVASNCRSINVCRQMAFNNAAIDYANRASSYVRGRVNSDILGDAADPKAKEEFDRFYAAYERLVGAEIKKGVISESYSIVRKKGDVNEYRILYTVNEDRAAKMRKKAMQEALEESKLAQDYANKVSEFVNEGFDRK
ncbi:hypothetical protein D0T49_02930 [Paludibacter sp. 221]|uniref:hypothetical protein n=1 Tax=Paludibacter sp. 221 TaxID=2302939 RepID=UPI0013D559CA|nr:hypothetical protein [Paludibacter sp. 221]NDV45993.1 hypothetical protein [Paludibacter sp. 221]